MNEFLDIPDDELIEAKQRIWSRMESKLPVRGLGEYQPFLSSFRSSREELEVSRLKRVQLKEQLMEALPQRPQYHQWFAATRRFLAVSTLSIFCLAFVLPVFEFGTFTASASSLSTLSAVQGEVFLNGQPLTEELRVNEGDHIETTEGSIARLELLDDSLVMLGPNTNMLVKRAHSDLFNKAETTVVLEQSSGRISPHVLNLNSESDFKVEVPQGSVQVDQSASFDVVVEEESSQIQVYKDFVITDMLDNNGILAEGAQMQVNEDLLTTTLPEEHDDEVWFSVNEQAREQHISELEENYSMVAEERAGVLPGEPLYFLKTIKEGFEETFTLSGDLREEVVAQHAETRLNEAVELIDQGDLETAQDTLEAFVEEAEKLKDSGNDRLLDTIDETQKTLLIGEGLGEDEEFILEAINDMAVVVANEEDEGVLLMEFASTQLALLSEVILVEEEALNDEVEVDGEPDTQVEANVEAEIAFHLEEYQDAFDEFFLAMEDLSFEEREFIVSSLLDAYLPDIHRLQVLEREGFVDGDAEIFRQLGMMILSFRERSLENLPEFFASTEDSDRQYEVFTRVKDVSELPEALDLQIELIEAEVVEENTDLAFDPLDVFDELEVLDIPHTDQAQDQANRSEEPANDPKAHDDL